VIERGQNLSLKFKSRVHTGCKCTAMNDFNGDLLFEFGIGSFRQVNLSHTAGTQSAQKSIRPYAIS
jgi:hypothetical protein